MATEKLLIDLWGIDMREVDISDCTDVEDILSAVITYLSEQPTIEAEPVIHAEWISKDGRICCSHCGYTRTLRLGYEMMVNIDGKWVSMERTKRCPDCGAHMDLKEADHEPLH